jgi:aldehyde:ferredoxin oxidoreductase
MSQEYPGYAGKIIWINLTTGKTHLEPTLRYAHRFIGGRGINAWIFFNNLPNNVGCFDPENLLIYGVGPLVGTLSPFSSRISIETKNVFTNGVGSANCGGHFGAEMKFAGFDHIVLVGRAPKPVYIFLSQGRVEIRDAKNIWGLSTWKTEKAIRDQEGDNEVRVSCIGPAGENLVKSACIMTDRAKAAGGSGVGAVIGSKNLKALAARGYQDIAIARPDEFIKSVDEAYRKIEAFPKAKSYREDGYYGVESYFGSPAWEAGFRPVRNGQDDYWDPEKIQKVSGNAMKKYRKKILACYGCPVGCMPWMEVDTGPYKIAGEGWWNNSSNSFCTRVDCDNPEAAIKTHLLTNQLGLDGDNASVVISWAFECFEKGLITVKETDGLELVWGNHDAMISLIEKLAYRKGFGDFLANGVKAASEKLGMGSEDLAVHIKGQDSVDGIRISKGWGFGVVTSTLGGRHLRGAIHSFNPKQFRSYDNVPWKVFMQEQFKAILDMTGTCLYNNGLLSWETKISESAAHHLAKITSALTGMNLDTNHLMMVGRQVHNIEKALNTLHGGFTRKDDYPPKKYWNEPVKSGPYKGDYIEHDIWELMLDEYYELQGWDKNTGLQKKETLDNLDLRHIAEVFSKANKI